MAVADDISLESSDRLADDEIIQKEEYFDNARLCFLDHPDQSDGDEDLLEEDLAYESCDIAVKVVNHKTVYDSDNKPYTLYIIEITLRFDPSPAGREGTPSGSGIGSITGRQLQRVKKLSMSLEKRFSEFYKLRTYLKRNFSEFFMTSQSGFNIPKRNFFNPRLNFDLSTISERARSFETFLQTLLMPNEAYRQRLFQDEIITAFLFENLRISSRLRLRAAHFADCVHELRSLYAITRFTYRTDAHPLVLRALLALIVALAFADPQALPTSVISELEEEVNKHAYSSFTTDSTAGTSTSASPRNNVQTDRQLQVVARRDLLYNVALRFARHAWRVLGSCGAWVLTDTASLAMYRDALLDAIQYLSVQRGNAQLGTSGYCELSAWQSDVFSPYASISRLRQAVIHDSFP